MRLPAITAICTILLAGCGADVAHRPGWEYLGQYRVPSGATLDGTVIGGLSGISYDATNDRYFVISDDRSAKNPARFYTARIALSVDGISAVDFVSTHPWLDRDGRPFEQLDTATSPPTVPPDPEGIALDERRQRLYWSSEGQQRDGVRLDPWVRIADLRGGYVGELPLPDAVTHGARENKALEGLSLTPDGRSLWAALEGPLHQDGELPDERHGASTRLLRFDLAPERVAGQFSYPLDPVVAGPGGDNGLSDLVALDDGSLLVVERGYGTHVAVRIYRATIEEGTTELTKTLVADLTTTPGLKPLDNIEGITLGPRLADGRQAVIAVSDDNFSPTQITQFLLFAM